MGRDERSIVVGEDGVGVGVLLYMVVWGRGRGMMRWVLSSVFKGVYMGLVGWGVGWLWDWVPWQGWLWCVLV